MDFYNDFNLYNYRREREKYGHFLKVLCLQTTAVILLLLLQFSSYISLETCYLSTLVTVLSTQVGVLFAYTYSRYREGQEVVYIEDVPLQY